MTDTTEDVIVLDTYTDEFMDATIARLPAVREWQDLRTVPVGWRQSVWAAAYAVAYRTVVQPRGVDSGARDMAEDQFEPTDVPFDVAIQAEVTRFHAGHRPPRMETLNRPAKGEQ